MHYVCYLGGSSFACFKEPFQLKRCDYSSGYFTGEWTKHGAGFCIICIAWLLNSMEGVENSDFVTIRCSFS